MSAHFHDMHIELALAVYSRQTVDIVTTVGSELIQKDLQLNSP